MLTLIYISRICLFVIFMYFTHLFLFLLLLKRMDLVGSSGVNRSSKESVIHCLDPPHHGCVFLTYVCLPLFSPSLLFCSMLLSLADYVCRAFGVRPVLIRLNNMAQSSAHLRHQMVIVTFVLVLLCSWFTEVIGINRSMRERMRGREINAKDL